MSIKTYKKGSGEKLSANFKVSEFACKGSGCCAAVKVDDKLVTYLQLIRDHFSKPVTVNSGYRCPVHNKRVGGAAQSKHMGGMAADIAVEGVKPAEVAKYAESLGIRGIGLYPTFVHIDTRTKKSFWYGSGEEYRSTFGGTPPYSLEDFIEDVQRASGALVDGVAGPETLGKTATLSRWFNRRHALVKPIQKRLEALGYYEATVDGIYGKQTAAAVKAFQTANGCATDGVVTKKQKTWKKLLGMA